MRVGTIFILSATLFMVRASEGESAASEGPRGSYYWSSRVSQALDAKLTFEKGLVTVEYLFHYPAYRGTHGSYSDLLYFVSTPIEYHYNESSKVVLFNVTRGHNTDNDFHMLFGHMSQWVFDYNPRDPDRHSYIDGDVLKDCIFNKTADSVNLAFFLGYVDFKKEKGDPVDLEAKFNALRDTGRFANPIMINRQLGMSLHGSMKSSDIRRTIYSQVAVIALLYAYII